MTSNSMEYDKSKCPIWGTFASFVDEHDYGERITFRSNRAGGTFTITRTIMAIMPKLASIEKAKLTTWIVDQIRLGNTTPLVDSDVVNQISGSRGLGITDRRDRLLSYLDCPPRRLGATLRIASVNFEGVAKSRDELMSWTESTDWDEVFYLVKFATEEGFIAMTKSPEIDIFLTPKGYEHIDQNTKRNIGSSQAFVAMWFHDSTSDAYSDGFAKAIQLAGYRPLRIDQKEHINKIDDEIIAEIRRSRFLVADFTSEPGKPRGGVYFEAGFAYGLNIPVIWTCREDVIDHVHFDTRQFNHIVWKDPEDIVKRLKNRIEAVIGEGPLKDSA